MRATLGVPAVKRLQSFPAQLDPQYGRTLVSPAVAQSLGAEILAAPAHLALDGALVAVPSAVVLVSVDGCPLVPLVAALAEGLPTPVVLGADWIALRG